MDVPLSDEMQARFNHPTLPYRYSRPFDLRVEQQFQSFEGGFGSIGLVSCSSEKLECRAPARDLYTSQLFRKAARTCEAMHMDWAILSAKHGLVLPDQVIDPYDVTFKDLTRDERAVWGIRTQKQITQRWGRRRTVWVYAGRAYLSAVAGLNVVAPLGKMGIGHRLKKLTDDLPRRVAEAINGVHAWTFQDRRGGSTIAGSCPGAATAAAGFASFTQFYPEGFPWETHYTTRSCPPLKEILTHYAITTQDPVLFRRRVFAKATGLSLPSEPSWLTSVTPELERT